MCAGHGIYALSKALTETFHSPGPSSEWQVITLSDVSLRPQQTDLELTSALDEALLASQPFLKGCAVGKPPPEVTVSRLEILPRPGAGRRERPGAAAAGWSLPSTLPPEEPSPGSPHPGCPGFSPRGRSPTPSPSPARSQAGSPAQFLRPRRLPRAGRGQRRRRGPAGRDSGILPCATAEGAGLGRATCRSWPSRGGQEGLRHPSLRYSGGGGAPGGPPAGPGRGEQGGTPASFPVLQQRGRAPGGPPAGPGRGRAGRDSGILPLPYYEGGSGRATCRSGSGREGLRHPSLRYSGGAGLREGHLQVRGPAGGGQEGLRHPSLRYSRRGGAPGAPPAGPGRGEQGGTPHPSLCYSRGAGSGGPPAGPGRGRAGRDSGILHRATAEGAGLREGHLQVRAGGRGGRDSGILHRATAEGAGLRERHLQVRAGAGRRDSGILPLPYYEGAGLREGHLQVRVGQGGTPASFPALQRRGRGSGGPPAGPGPAGGAGRRDSGILPCATAEGAGLREGHLQVLAQQGGRAGGTPASFPRYSGGAGLRERHLQRRAGAQEGHLQVRAGGRGGRDSGILHRATAEGAGLRERHLQVRAGGEQGGTPASFPARQRRGRGSGRATYRSGSGREGLRHPSLRYSGGAGSGSATCRSGSGREGLRHPSLRYSGGAGPREGHLQVRAGGRGGRDSGILPCATAEGRGSGSATCRSGSGREGLRHPSLPYYEGAGLREGLLRGPGRGAGWEGLRHPSPRNSGGGGAPGAPPAGPGRAGGGQGGSGSPRASGLPAAGLHRLRALSRRRS
ncbi:spidroin-1-like [Sarcophilus harrisii]|uniref:spidroin-1-like n=1 Tax=Sarcophilus harrisii TaxID=9305 RepID=UPI001301A3F6|nr:spidroin-1-like [Sarcophilus harrisii]